jgi:hypothetical protein
MPELEAQVRAWRPDCQATIEGNAGERLQAAGGESDATRAAGWKLLFDGNTTVGHASVAAGKPESQDEGIRVAPPEAIQADILQDP